ALEADRGQVADRRANAQGKRREIAVAHRDRVLRPQLRARGVQGVGEADFHEERLIVVDRRRRSRGEAVRGRKIGRKSRRRRQKRSERARSAAQRARKRRTHRRLPSTERFLSIRSKSSINDARLTSV